MISLLRSGPDQSGGLSAWGYTIGENIAATPGKIVFRDHLMELIQYAPATENPCAEPVLLVSSWIMKYYILDLAPAHSMIGWLVRSGHTVFAISWRNPGVELGNASLEDYRLSGVMAAIDAVSAICGTEKTHAVGYCLGGTLLTIAASAMARENDLRLASLSLFASQIDFTEVGGLQLAVTAFQLDVLDDILEAQGYLDSEQLAGAAMLPAASNPAIPASIHDYLHGENDSLSDLAACSGDLPRVPPRMHIEYLRRLFLHNDLTQGRFQAAGRPVSLRAIDLPMFVVGMDRDQVVPWKSIFRLHGLNDSELTFVLTTGGHKSGIVCGPENMNRHFRVRTCQPGVSTPGPDEWERTTPARSGSWWVTWGAWLNERSRTGRRGLARLGSPAYPPIGDAPGPYVREA